MEQVDQTPIEQRQPAVGVLTTEHRDTWGPVSLLFIFLCSALKKNKIDSSTNGVRSNKC